VPRQVHVCDVCGHKGAWQKGWMWKWILAGKGLRGWEYEYKVCSDECFKKAEKENLIELKRKELRT
jgi:hypothetical protein